MSYMEEVQHQLEQRACSLMEQACELLIAIAPDIEAAMRLLQDTQEEIVQGAITQLEQQFEEEQGEPS